MQGRASLIASLILGCSGPGALVPPSSPSPPAEPIVLPPRGSGDIASPVDAVRPSVVLIVTDRPDGKPASGAGLVVSQTGHVLTGPHVSAGAKKIRAMLFRQGRVTYTPMDGGLTRFLYENQSELIAAEEVDRASTTDLAVIKIDADTSAQAAVRFSTDPLRVGEAILVLGHPQEAVWSFTSGLVSALPSGVIQHDAMVSQGSSGGPVLNARGEVIGISTAKGISEARGFAFARPIAMAAEWLHQSLQYPPLDLATPAAAAMSCWRAVELGSPRLIDCFDWDLNWSTYMESAGELVRRFDADLAQRLERETLREKEAWIEREKSALQRWAKRGFFCTDAPSAGEAGPKEVGLVREKERLLSSIESRKKGLVHSWVERNGIKEDLYSTGALVRMLHRGLRVRDVRVVRSDLAWVLLTGRNPDGSELRFSEAYTLSGDRWRQRSPPHPDDVATLPSGWAAPLEDHELAKQKRLLSLIEELLHQRPGCAPESSLSDPRVNGA